MDKLTPDQARTVGAALGPARGYLARLVERMDRTNLRHADPKLYRLVRAAEDAMHALGVELHYQSCGHGVGRPGAAGGSLLASHSPVCQDWPVDDPATASPPMTRGGEP